MRLERNAVSRLFVAFCASLAFACAASAREEPQARKVSDYVNQYTSCNAGAHLDNFAIELQNDPAATGQVIIYGPQSNYGERAVKAIKGYLVNARGLDESRFQVVYAGLYQNMPEFKKNGFGEHKLIIMVAPTRESQWGGEIETWVVPPGALLPDPSADDIDIEVEGTENP